MNLGTIYKLPAEVLTRVVDFSNDLASGETISSINSANAVLYPSGPDESATIIGPVAPFIPAGNKTVQFQVQNGAVGQLFTLTITVTSSAGNIFQGLLTLAVGLEIDLTTLANVANWIAPYKVGDTTSEDQVIQDAITAFSSWVLRATGRGPMDGSYPTQSPFVQPVLYDDFYDGSGTWRQPIRNWPMTQGNYLNINGVRQSQSMSVNVPGWVIDGDGRFLSMRGGYSTGPATFQNYGWQGLRGGGGIAGVAPGGFCKGIQNVEWNYYAGFATVPTDLEMTARKVVSLYYKRRSWIGQKTQAMAAGAGTVSYGDWEMDRADQQVLEYYKVRIS